MRRLKVTRGAKEQFLSALKEKKKDISTAHKSDRKSSLQPCLADQQPVIHHT